MLHSKQLRSNMRCVSFGWYSFDFSIEFSSIHDLYSRAWGKRQNWEKNLKIGSIPSPTPFLAALVALYLQVSGTDSWSIIQRYQRGNESFLNRWPPPPPKVLKPTASIELNFGQRGQIQSVSTRLTKHNGLILHKTDSMLGSWWNI